MSSTAPKEIPLMAETCAIWGAKVGNLLSKTGNSLLLGVRIQRLGSSEEKEKQMETEMENKKCQHRYYTAVSTIKRMCIEN